jgi:protein TonB
MGLLILSAHVGVIALFALGGRVAPGGREPPAVSVEFLEQPSTVEVPRLSELSKLSEHKLVSLAPLTVDVPEVALPVETEIPAGDTPEVQLSSAPSPGIVPGGGGGSGDLPSLSEVAYLHPPAPGYPGASKRAREEGVVILKVVVDESGHAGSVYVYRSSGHPRLDAAACEAVRRALFKPYVEGGVARASVAMVPVEFSLHGVGERGRRGG